MAENNQDSVREDYTFYLEDGATKTIITTKEQMLITFRKSNNVSFVIKGQPDPKYVFKEGLWIIEKDKNKENEDDF